MKTCTCGCPITFGIGENGRRIPLENRTDTYILQGNRAIRVTEVYVNHYRTCPNASSFRKPKPEAKPTSPS